MLSFKINLKLTHLCFSGVILELHVALRGTAGPIQQEVPHSPPAALIESHNPAFGCSGLLAALRATGQELYVCFKDLSRAGARGPLDLPVSPQNSFTFFFFNYYYQHRNLFHFK